MPSKLPPPEIVASQLSAQRYLVTIGYERLAQLKLITGYANWVERHAELNGETWLVTVFGIDILNFLATADQFGAVVEEAAEDLPA